MPPPRWPLSALAASAETIFPAGTLPLPTAIAWSNLDTTGRPEFAIASLFGAYAARDVPMDPVTLCRLPEGSAVLGHTGFVVRADGAYIAEQISPLMTGLDATIALLEPEHRAPQDVAEPTILLARYGEATWGHWLGEILPRAVVAERAAPGRFRYAVAGHVTQRQGRRGFADSVLESLAAYGIGEDRLLRLDPSRTYRFKSLYSVAGLWSAAAMHPDVLALMRALSGDDAGDWPGRLAILRRDTLNRTLFNGDTAETILTGAGYTVREIGGLPFLSQVAAFRRAHHVFGVLGSGLTGLLYAPHGVRVITAAPEGWFDCFFQQFIQQLGGLNAELRAHTLWSGEGLPRDAPLVLDPALLPRAIAAMDTPEPDLFPAGWARVAGRPMPRRLGPVLAALDFRAGGNVASALRFGWGAQEPGHVFTEGPVSALEWPTPPGACVMELTVAAFAAPPHLVSRPLTIDCNGHVLGTWPLSGVATLLCRLPPEAVASSPTLVFSFAHPIHAPLSALGAGSDDRNLSIAFIALRIRAEPP